MAMPRRVRVEFGEAFPMGVYAFADAVVQPARDFDKSKPGAPVQAVDEDSGLPVWTLDVMDADPEARKNAKAITVRIVAATCPVLPDSVTGPVRAVEFEGLSASPYVADSPMGTGKGRLAWSFRATGLRAPSRGAGARQAGQSGGHGQKEQAA